MPELELWMRVGQPLEPVLADQERLLDVWQSGGVRGLVIGRLLFLAEYTDTAERAEGEGAAQAAPQAAPPPATWDGLRPGTVPAFAANHTVYRRWNVAPPPAPAQSFPERLEQLQKLIEAAKRRGWPVYLYEPAAGQGGEAECGPAILLDGSRQRSYLARLEDAIGQLPQADGVILDGPHWGYEIAHGHDSSLFDDLSAEQTAGNTNVDFDRLLSAQGRLNQRLHKLSREQATLAGAGGLFATLALIGNDPGIVAWLAFRARAVTTFFQQVHQLCEALTRTRGRQVKLGITTPTPSLMVLAGYDLPATAANFDLIVPKLGVWHRGTGGLYGTVGRWVSTLADWNPGLWEPEAFAAVKALLGIALPSTEPDAKPGQTMSGLRELERGFPDAFFRETMTSEVRRALAAADGYPWRLLPAVDAGRRPQGGDPVTAHDLRRLLVAAKEGGARHVLFHNHGHLTAAEWMVLSEYCGSSWRAGPGLYGSYAPPDAERAHG